MNLQNNAKKYYVPIAIAVIVIAAFALALKLRATPALIDPPWLPQFDSYWFYRYAKMTVDNGGALPDWDPLSYFPPGRPTDKSTQFYTYLLAYAFMLGKSFFVNLNLVQSTKWTAAILASLSVFPAYFIGKYMGGRAAGVISAIMIAVSPSILVRTGADPDNDGAVVFLTMLSMFAFSRLLKSPNWKNTLLTITALTMFALSWYPFWYVVVVSVGGILLNIAIAFAQSAAKKNNNLFQHVLGESMPRLKHSAAAILGAVIIPLLFGVNTLSYFGGFILFGTNPQGSSIVNVSVAELQKLNIFSLSGWEQILGRTAGLEFLGYVTPSLPQPFALASELLISILMFYLSWEFLRKNKKTESVLFSANAAAVIYLAYLGVSLTLFLQIMLFLSMVQYAILAAFRKNRFMGSMLFVWCVFTFYAISSGVRFTLLFAPGAAIAFSVGLGELWLWANRKEAGVLQTVENKILGERDE